MISEEVAGRTVVADGGDIPETDVADGGDVTGTDVADGGDVPATDVADDVPESSGVQVTSFCGSMTPPAWLM